MATSQEIQLRLRAISDFSDLTGDINQVQQMLNKIKMPPQLKQSFDGVFSDLTKETKKYQNFLDSGFKKKSDVTGLEQSGQRISKTLQKLKGEMGKIDSSMLEQSFNVDPSKLQSLQKEMDQLRQKFTQKINTNTFKELDNEVQMITKDMAGLSKSKAVQQFADSFKDGNIKGAEQALAQLWANLNKFKEGSGNKGKMTTDLEELEKLLNRMKTETGLDQISQDIQNLDQKMDQLDADELQEFVNTFNQGKNSIDGMTKELEEFNQKTNQAAQSQNGFASQLGQLKSQVQYFFGLTNAVYLLRSALRGALETVKELDATMTEAAVVTDFSVGDMWNKLPEYTKVAQQLGVSINGLYQATTLYYQQGLKTNEAMQLGIETMKMAKIAGMESTEATQAMTAALRGFNMELNETSATRVNDVYSQLAAVTAADTEQIATAMNKTASIAHSANMEFETTAALLAQIIETTQEAPETAGTAMKTIIARFSEVKSLKEAGKSKGEDTEGEGIDVNKIQTALGTVGISMEGFFAGTERLDSILLKLAEKWDDLDFTTQRYIATMAAGSRQQSRFIAMMSDYGRTTELVTEAQNSAGASQKQFNKTSESLESILTRLKNAWDSFLMGLANNEVIKDSIQGLTAILNGVNNLISGLPGLTKSFASLALAFAGIFTASKVVNAALDSVAARFAAGGKAAGASFWKSLSKEFAFIKTMFAKQTYTLPPINTVPQELALKRLETAQKKVVVTQKLVDSANKKSSASDLAKSITTRNAALAEEEYQKQLLETGAALGVSSANMGMFTTLTAAGILPTIAATAAEKGLTTELYNEMAAKVAMMGLTGEAAAAKLQEMLATWSLLAAKKAENDVDSLTLGQKLGLIATMIFGTKAKKKETLEHWQAVVAKSGETTATWLLTVANWAANASMLAVTLTVIALIAVIAAVVIGIIALVKWIKDLVESTDDVKKLKKLNQQIQELGSAVDEAKEKFDNLTDAKNGLEELRNKLKTLTKGTVEWKQTLIETNQKVLDLMSNFPELTQYVGRGEYGELTISEEGWEQVLGQQQQVITNNSSAKAVKQQEAAEDQLKIDAEEILSKAYGDVWGDSYVEAYGGDKEYYKQQKKKDIQTTFDSGTGDQGSTYLKYVKNEDGTYQAKAQSITGGLSTTEYMEFAAQAAARGLSMVGGSSENQFRTLFDELGYEGDFDVLWASMNDAREAFDQVANSAHAVAVAEEARVRSIATGVAQNNSIVSNSEDFGAAATDLGAQLYNNYSELLKEETNNITTKKNKRDVNRHNAAAIKEYAESQGMTEDEVKAKIKDKSLSYETIESVIAADRVNEKLESTMENMVKNLETLTANKSKNEKRQIAGLMSNKGLDLTMQDIASMSEFTSIEDYMSKMGIDEAFANSIGVKFEDLTEELKSNFENAKSSLMDAFYSPLVYGLGGTLRTNIEALAQTFEDLGATAGYTIEQTKQLSQALAQIELNGGDSVRVTELFGDLVKGLKGEDLNTAMAILAQTNWTSQQSINSTIDSLRALGAVIDRSLVREVVEASNAISDLSLSEFKAGLSSQKELRDNLQKKIDTGVSTFTQAEVEQLKEFGYKDTDFVMTDVDEYTFMNDTNEILKKIQGDSNNILQEMLGDKKKAVEKGEKIEEWEQTTEPTDTKDTWDILQDGRVHFDRSGKAHDAAINYMEGGGTFVGEVLGETGKEMQHFYEAFSEDKLKEANWQHVAEKIGFVWSDAQTETENTQRWRTLMENYAADEARRRGDISDTEYEEYKGTDAGYGTEVSNEDMIKLAENWGIDPKEYEGLSGEAFSQFLQTYYDNYFKTLDTNREELKSEEEGASQFLYAQQIGKHGYDSNEVATQVMDAYIQSQSGLGVAIENTEKQLKDWGMQFNKNSNYIKNFVAANHKANQAMDTLNSTIKDQADALKLENENLNAYQSALEKVAASASKAFDTEVTTQFVNEHIALFQQLSEGGEVAQAAFEAIGQELAIDYIESLGEVADATYAINSALSTIPSDLRVGVAFDAGNAIEALKNLGLNAKYAMAVLDKMGYTVDYQIMWQSSTTPGLTDKFNPMTGHIKPIRVYTGMKRGAGGTSYGGSGGGGGGSSNEWKNPYDELYNTVAKINEELRKREKLERRYQNLLNRNTATAKGLADLTRQQLASLKVELADRETVLDGRRRQMNEIMTEYSDVGQYARYDEKLGQIVINWDKLEALDSSTNEELTSRVEEYISKLEEKEGQYEDEEAAIEDIRDAAWAIYEQGKDSYFDLENQIKEAIIAERQKEIDKLTEINESITDANQKILDSLQEQIDEYRQNRDNEKTEEELSDRQRRLAYLQQDTSGANAMEILNLQKELEESQESYTDTLIDQKISELQKQNDEAAEQRQQQIDIAQAQLDQYSESAAIWEEVNSLMSDGFDPENGLIRGSRLEELLKSADGFDGMSKLKQMDWLNELNNTAAQALAWLQGGALQNLYGQGGQVTFTDKDGNIITGTINEDGDVETGDGRLYSGEKFKVDQSGKVTSYESGNNAQTNWQEAQEQEEEDEEKTGVGDIASLPASTKLTKENKEALQRGLNRLLEHGKLSGFAKLTVDGNLGSQSMAALAILQKAIGMSTTGAWGPKTYKAFHSSDLKAYETGGLADFTGPAWLDGTKSRPEYILNADQTKAFFNLVDVLGSLQSGDSKTTQNNGDTNYDIDINVESIGNDYDVEQLASKVKSLINEDARYRNNNAINLMR